jgi:hypothetical protein
LVGRSLSGDHVGRERPRRHGHRNWLIALLIYRHTRRLQHYLGHARITNTVRYTAMSPEPFKVIW